MANKKSSSSKVEVKVKKIDLDDNKTKKTSKKPNKSKSSTINKVNKTSKKITKSKHASKLNKINKTKKSDIKKSKHVKKAINIKSIIVYLFLCLFIFGIIYSGINIIKWKKNVDENKNITEDLKDKIKEETDDNGDVVYSVDFNALKDINKDVVGYLDYKQFKINYVVVQGKDNDYYLNHNFNKKYNDAGWIFADYRNKINSKDKNIVIYGHSMKNGSMFGSLHNILKNKNYTKEENQTFKFITEDGTYIYKLFSVYTVEAEDYYITTDFNSNNEWSNYIKTMKSRSIYNFKVDVKNSDTIITLSTCQGYEGDKRLVVQAVRVNEE